MNSPLVPKACDLTDFPHMAVDVRRLLNSETWILGNDAEKAASMTLWLESWHQIPSGSIPSNDKMLAHLSGAGSKWAKAKEHVLRGWVLCDDGRYYHPVVAEKALEAWIEKLYAAISGNNGNTKRWGIEIDNSELEAKLRDAVIRLQELAPRSKALNKKIVKIVQAQSQGNSQSVSGGDSGGDRNREGEREGEDSSSFIGQVGFEKNLVDSGLSDLTNEFRQAAIASFPTLTNSSISVLWERFKNYFVKNSHVVRTPDQWLDDWKLSVSKYAPGEIAKDTKQPPSQKPPQRTTDTTKQRERKFDEYHDGEVYSQGYTAGLIRKSMQADESPEQCMLRLTTEKLAKAKAVNS